MSQLIAFTVNEEMEILIESSEPRTGPVSVSGLSGVKRARSHFDRVLDQVGEIADAVVDRISGLAKKPDEVTVELGVGITGSADVFIAQSTANAAFKVTLTWNSPDSRRS